MTTAAGDDAVEQAFEALLAGRPVPSAEHRLVAFSDAVRASATAPGRPSAALADLLVTGLLTDQSSPSDATARSAARAARRAPARSRTRRLRMLAPAMFAKFLSAGLAAKAATVAGVVVVGFSTAGFTGNLPTNVQQTFATVVDDATPFTAPTPDTAGTDGETSTDSSGTATDTSGDSTDTTGDPTDATDGSAGTGQGDDTQGDDSRGSSTDSSDSQGDQTQGEQTQGDQTQGVVQHPAHPENHGKDVSEAAHARNQARHNSAAQAGKQGDDQSQATSTDDSSADDNSADDNSDDNSGDVSGDDGSGDSAQTAGGSSHDSSEDGSSHGGSSHGGSSHGSGDDSQN